MPYLQITLSLSLSRTGYSAVVVIIIIIIIIIIMSILLKDRFFTANSGTKSAVLLKGRSSTANSENQTAVLLGMDRCGSFPLLSATHSLFSIWTDLKRSEKIPVAPTWRWGEWIWLTGPSGLHRNSPQGLNIVSIRGFDQIRDPEIPINLRPRCSISKLYRGFSAYQHQRSLAPMMNKFWWLWWPMISGDGWELSFSDICVTVEEKLWKNLNQEKWLDRGSNPGLLGERQRCYPWTTAVVIPLLNYLWISNVLILMYKHWKTTMNISLHTRIWYFTTIFALSGDNDSWSNGVTSLPLHKR